MKEQQKQWKKMDSAINTMLDSSDNEMIKAADLANSAPESPEKTKVQSILRRLNEAKNNGNYNPNTFAGLIEEAKELMKS